MKFDYLLEAACLAGGVKVVFEQAAALNDAGHTVRIIARTGPPTWFSLSVPFLQADTFRSQLFTDTDVIVATSCNQLPPLFNNPATRHRLVHLFQGYEGGLPEAEPYRDIINEAYGLPVPRWAVSERLSRYADELCGGRAPVATVGQAIDHRVFFPPETDTRRGPTVLVIGDLPNTAKGIPECLGALREARRHIPDLRIVRIAPRDFRADEDLQESDTYLVALKPAEVAAVMRDCRILLNCSTEAEGFGLPVLEAMACGLPVVAPAIEAYRALDPNGAALAFPAANTATALAASVVDLWNNEQRRENMRRAGLEIADRHRYKYVVRRIEDWLRDRASRQRPRDTNG